MRNGKSFPIFLLVVVFLLTVPVACGSEPPEETATAAAILSPEPTATTRSTAAPVALTPEPDVTATRMEPVVAVTEEIEPTFSPGSSGLTAVITSGESAGAGKPFTFNATQSQAGDVPIVNYVWNMGDGATLFGRSVEHSYAELGFYTVTLTITDEDGQTDTTAKVVEVIPLEDLLTPTAESESALNGTSWLMNNALRGTTVTLVFAAETLSGSPGCNSYSATYSVTPVEDFTYNISIHTIGSTGESCTSEVMAQEDGYLESLASAHSLTIDGETLILETGSGTLTFRMAPE